MKTLIMSDNYSDAAGKKEKKKKDKDLIVRNGREKKCRRNLFFGPGGDLRSLFEQSNVQTPHGGACAALLPCLRDG